MEVSMENILVLLFGVRFGFCLLSCSLICAQLPLELRFIIELLWGRNFKTLKEGLTVDRRNNSDDHIEHSMLRNCTGDTLRHVYFRLISHRCLRFSFVGSTKAIIFNVSELWSRDLKKRAWSACSERTPGRGRSCRVGSRLRDAPLFCALGQSHPFWKVRSVTVSAPELRGYAAIGNWKGSVSSSHTWGQTRWAF